MSECRSCGAKIIWTTTTATGKRMPVDPEPVVGGNVVLVTGNDGPESEVVDEAEAVRRQAFGFRLRRSHFSTCPQSKQWRRP